jgi:hypothetical protein
MLAIVGVGTVDFRARELGKGASGYRDSPQKQENLDSVVYFYPFTRKREVLFSDSAKPKAQFGIPYPYLTNFLGRAIVGFGIVERLAMRKQCV